jgi:hypothetical protein
MYSTIATLVATNSAGTLFNGLALQDRYTANYVTEGPKRSAIHYTDAAQDRLAFLLRTVAKQ